MKNTLINTDVVLATTNTSIVESATGEDTILDAVIAYNSHSSAIVVTLTLGAIFVVKSVAAWATVNLIDGFVLPIKAGETFYGKAATWAKVNIKAIGKKASAGNLTTSAVLGS